MSAPKYSAEFKEQVVLEIIQRSRPVAEVARSYGLAPADRGQLGREMAQGAPGTRDGEFLERGERRRPRRLKAEPCEARMEAEPPGRKRRPSPAPGVPVSVKYGFIRGEEGNYPVRSMCRWAKVSRSGYYAWRNRPLSATARRRQDLTVIGARFFADPRPDPAATSRIRAGPARHGAQSRRARASGRPWPPTT